MNFLFRVSVRCVLPLFLAFLSWSCVKDITDLDKYQNPPWVKGKMFTQISNEEDLTTFIECLQRTGYDTLLEKSGSYTVFAPTNEAFQRFFQEHPGYNSVKDISDKELKAIVENQILLNAWSREQFQTLDISGWIDKDNEFSKPRAFKRLTLLLGDNKKYPVKRYGNYYRIVDPYDATDIKVSFTQSNKYSPIFFQEFFSINDLGYNDYDFYFNRSFEPGKLYFAEAELIADIPAENGFLYKTDRVVMPLPNGEQILEQGYNGISYKKFLSLVHFFSNFQMNLEATFDQPGAEQGLRVDTLYNLSYPNLPFNISSELTASNNSRNSYAEHSGLLAPTDETLESFINQYLSQWGDYKTLPEKIKKIIVNSYMTNRAVFETNITEGFLNGLNDSVVINPTHIVQKQFGSNCSFIGLNEPIIPRVLTSVCKPLYLTREYEIMMYACEDTKVLTALKKNNSDFGFFLPSDKVIGTSGDSSLIRKVYNIELDQYNWIGLSRTELIAKSRDIGEIRNQLMNQISETTPTGSAKKEFLRTLGGNFIIYNNENGIATGTSPSKYGYEGTDDIDIYPEEYTEYTDNGKVYLVNGWFSFERATDLVGILLSNYPYFLSLLEKAGLYDKVFYDIPFLVDGEYYTVFVPTKEALQEYRVDTLTVPELSDFIKYHFVKGNMIFTDGKMPDRNYSTALGISGSSLYSTLHINPEPDRIEILDKNGNLYTVINENGNKTNQMIMYDSKPDPSSISNWDYIVTGVVHEVERVLVKDQLQKE